MEERLVRKLAEEMLSKPRFRVHRIAGALATGGFESFYRISDDEVAEIEAEGFDINKVQNFIDDLELRSRYADAAMLRGAFNDLLSRVPDEPSAEDTPETEAA